MDFGFCEKLTGSVSEVTLVRGFPSAITSTGGDPRTVLLSVERSDVTVKLFKTGFWILDLFHRCGLLKGVSGGLYHQGMSVISQR
ncbi:MAG: hypothetical protein HC903_16820 [Methylacidiphilales bacterium]|nr:hypothetical protein [Candidatus Methylacidiphilales bacterium]